MIFNYLIIFNFLKIILPPVPLKVQSKCQFKIINDGYENLNLKYNIPQDLGPINIELNFPDGKSIGITKNKFKILKILKKKNYFKK